MQTAGATAKAPPHPAPRRLGHVPALDGLRGAAVLAVIAYHYRTGHVIVGGWAGVDVFFVLSGFLITCLLLQERDRTGGVRLKAFFTRRALRLLPAVGVFLALWIAMLLAFGHTRWFWSFDGAVGPVVPSHPGAVAFSDIGAAVSYTMNWVAAAGRGSAAIRHLWSLSIEEQFYLVWPIALAAIMRLRRPAVVTAGLAATSAAWCAAVMLHTGDIARATFGTDTRAQALLLGAATAMAWRSGAFGRLSERSSRRAAAMATGVLGVALIGLRDTSSLRFTVGLPALALASAAVIVHLANGHASAVARTLGHPLLRYLGRRSYALYLWHYPLGNWARGLGWGGFVLALTLSLAAAELSFRLVERPALALKARLLPAT